MTINIPTHFIDQYKGNVMHLLQRGGGKYRSCVTEDNYEGEQAVVVNQYGAAEMSEVTTRYEAMGRADPTTQRVWLDAKFFDVPFLIDTFDKLKVALIDPESELAKTGAKAAQRQMDNVVSDNFFADMLVGQKGASTQSFDTTNHRVGADVGAGADTGMNVEKVLRAKRLLLENEVDLDEDEVCLAIHPKQEEDLLNQTKVINGDYFSNGGRAVLEEGKLKYFAGCKIVCTTKVPSDSSYRLNPMWVKSGMHLGLWQDIKVQAHERPDLRGVPMQVYVTLGVNATRTEAGRVIQIRSTEA